MWKLPDRLVRRPPHSLSAGGVVGSSGATVGTGIEIVVEGVSGTESVVGIGDVLESEGVFVSEDTVGFEVVLGAESTVGVPFSGTTTAVGVKIISEDIKVEVFFEAVVWDEETVAE